LNQLIKYLTNTTKAAAWNSLMLSPALIPKLIRLNPQFFESGTQTPCLRKITADCQQNRASTALEQYKVEHAHMATRYFSL
jgi:hypothetical protein